MKSRIAPILVEAPLGTDQGPGQNQAGLICAANEARFTSAHYSEPLTAYTVGWRDPENIDALLDRLFPAIQVGRRFEFKKAVNAEAFLSETDDIRPIGSPFKQVEYKGTSVSDKTHNRGLMIRVDHDEIEAGDTGWRERYVSILLQRLKRNSLRRGFAILDGADHAGGNTAFTAATNPDGLIRAMGKTSADTSGLYPNCYAIGELAWHYRLDAYEAPTRVNAAGRASMTPQALAQYLMADVVEVVKARYQSSATAKSAVLSARIYAYSEFQGQTKDDPSAIKRFVSSARGGQRYGVYVTEHEKFTEIAVECYENIVATGVGVESIDATNA